MKTLKKFILLLLLTGLFTSGSCSDDDDFTPTLPPITQTGENTFGCYVDGKLLTPRDGTGTFNSPDPGMRTVAGGIPPEITYWELKIRDFKSGSGGLLTIHMQGLHQTEEGTYTINEGNCEDGVDAIENINITCRIFDDTTQTYKWYCSMENAGTIEITYYNRNEGIVSGTFSCTVQDRNNPLDKIEITQGRFDINSYKLEYTNFP